MIGRFPDGFSAKKLGKDDGAELLAAIDRFAEAFEIPRNVALCEIATLVDRAADAEALRRRFDVRC